MPLCSARRSHVTAAHLVDDVLPPAPYRQWTLSFPFRLRWALVKTPRLLAQLQRALFALVAARQRKHARRLGLEGRLHAAAVTMTQYFGSRLQLTPHFHSLVPDGVFVERDGAVTFQALPPPTPGEVAALARRLVRRARRLLEKQGLLEADVYPEDGLDALRLASLQERLPLREAPQPPRALHGLLAVVDGFSLHADTWVHAHDRQSLERLARYGARGPLAASRLTLRDDGRVEYALRRPAAAVLVLTPAAFLGRLAALVPPPGKHLGHFHGGFGPNARVRKALVALARPSTAAPPPSPPPPRPQAELPLRLAPPPRPPRLDWAGLLRRTFALGVFTCARCGGPRRVLAVVTRRDTARELLLAMGHAADAPTTGPPRRLQLALAF